MRSRWTQCVIIGLAFLALSGAGAEGQECTVGGQFGGALATPSVPFGDVGNIETGGGISMAVDLGCDVGPVKLGVAPELNQLGGIRTWHFLGGAGVRLPIGTRDGGAWIEPMLQAGIAIGDHDGPIIAVLPDGRYVDLPSGVRPAMGAAVRVGIPVGSGIGFIEPSMRITSFPTMEGTEPAGAHTFVTVPIRIGYAFRLFGPS